MRLARFTVLALAGLALTACAATGPVSRTDRATAYFARDFTCSASDSRSVDLTALRRAPQRYDGQCVTVLGFAKANILFHDAHDAAAAATTPRLGLDWNDAALARHLRLGPSFVTLTGRVRLCRRRKAMIAKKAPATPETGCRGAVAALTVSSAKVVPTAMD